MVTAAAPALPDVLLPYQRELLEATGKHQVVVVEKSRRIGATWGIAADAVLTAGAERKSGGQDVFYIGYNQEMTREFIDTCAMWAKSFLAVAVEVKEFLFKEQSETAGDREIQAFRITFASGFEIVALCSRPRSLRGRQGYVIIDEAAFHDEIDELLKAALALLIWGGRVLIISTHNGVENPYNQLIEDCRAKRKPYHLVRVTFDDAVRQGLYRRVCLSRGLAWTQEAEDAWVKEIRSFYGDAALEELDCVPMASGGKYIARSVLEARATEAPVLRWTAPDGFVDMPEDARIADCKAWCDEHIAPALAGVNTSGVRSYVGEDFARSGDLTVMWPAIVQQDARLVTPFVLELRNVPFKQQEQVLFYLIDALPRFAGAALDARGNGQYLAEVTRQRYGAECIAEVMLSEGWYREHMPRLKSSLEDDTFSIPRDADLIDDLRSLEVVNGVARVPEKARKTATGQRHGDAAVAAALVVFAAATLEGGPLAFFVSGSTESLGAFSGYGELEQRDWTGFE